MTESLVDDVIGELGSLLIATEQLELEIERIHAEVENTELCNRVFASDVNEFKCKKSFLLSCSLHCHEIVNILVQYTSRVDRRTHQLSDAVPSSYVDKVERMCTQVQHLLHLMNSATDSNQELVENKKLVWTELEDLLEVCSCDGIISSLAATTAQETKTLGLITDSVNLHQDVKELQFNYKSTGQLTDEARLLTVLQSVNESIHLSQLSHVQQSLQTEHTYQAVLQSRNQLDVTQQNWHQFLSHGYITDDCSIHHKSMELKLELSGYRAALSTISSICQQLSLSQAKKKQEMRSLDVKRDQITQFKNVMEANQSKVKLLAKHNSAVKYCLHSQNAEVGLYIQQHVFSHQTDLILHATSLTSAMLREITVIMRYLNVPPLTRSSNMSLAVNDFTIHQLQRHLTLRSEVSDTLPVFNLQNLHTVVSPVEALSNCLVTIIEVKAFQETDAFEEGLSGMMQCPVLWKQVEVVTAAYKQWQGMQMNSVPALSKSLSLASCAIATFPGVEQLITEWWDQPALSSVHWMKVNGMTLKQWLDQWKVLAANYRQLRGNAL